jgi:hypothetical protein
MLKKEDTFFSMLKDKDVDKYIHSCMLGQTERGSYVTSIICPIDPQLNLVKERANNFGRKTTINLMKSLNNITEAIDNDPSHKTIEKSLRERKFNYNFCEALLELQPENKDSKIDVTVNWAAENKPVIEIPSRVTIRKEHYERLPKIIEKLSPKEEPKYEKFTGKVGVLEGEADEKQQYMLGRVILFLKWKNDIIRAKVFLNEDDYPHACDAHKKNLNISIEGKLVWAPRINNIENYRNFKVEN